ncbi:let-19 [Pristionchus pacificus]|uniref:Mediator of RNA polymerase II transcription subunit 13 n=1 Tax=Pristionchus pacificus TaxID=54126 RepID=A0A2A6CYT1_PRIPA|nr:let-19 [Pristionchus pacificus]|eukprot:PDM83217.1 let-19 [Pristionchus pacificus]
MSTANGGSLDDCITNLFALTELNGLQWRQYECPSWNIDSNPRTLLQNEPILVAYSKLQSDGILSVWRRVVKKSPPTVVNLLPTLDGTAPKELWVFWYGATEPEEIEKHCKDLIKKKNEDESEDGTVTGIPYDVRCLLYKSWNTQMEKHYRRKKFLQIGRWFVRPHKLIDPSIAFMIDDFVLAHCHSFNIVGGNSMCMAIKTQLQPNLVHIAPFHIERNKKNKDSRINVLLAPWSLNAHVSLRYSITPITKKEEEEVEKQLTQWKELNMFADQKRKKRRREEGGDTEGEESEDEGWGDIKTPKMIRVEVDGKQRMWWPTQYVLVTLEETRRIVRDRFPVADLLKCVPEKVSMFSRNRFAHLTNSDGSVRITQSVVDDSNFNMIENGKKIEMGLPKPDADIVSVYLTKRRLSDRKKKRKTQLTFEDRRRRKLENGMGAQRMVRVSSVSTDEGEDEGKEPNMKKEYKRMMVPNRFNCRSKNGRKNSKKETALRSMGLSSSDDDEEAEKKEVIEEKPEREWKYDNEKAIKIPRDISSMQPMQSIRALHKSTSKYRRKESNEIADESRLSKSKFTPVRALTPSSPQSEAAESEKFRSDASMSMGFQNEYTSYYDKKAAEMVPDIKYKPYHSRRNGPREHKERTRNKTDGRSRIDEVCSSDDDLLGEIHSCKRIREASPDVKPPRSHVIPDFEMEEVGGVNIPPPLDIPPDTVIREKKTSLFHPLRRSSIQFPELEGGDDFIELHYLKNLENRGYDIGSDEEPSDDRYSIGSDLQPPISTAVIDDAGEGTSSGAENWPRDEDEDMQDEYHHMDSSHDLMDTEGPSHSDSVLSPPASNERADSNNSMYPRLPGGPHSVGDTALNRIYPTPPSLLQVDICSPANMGGPHSQARKDDRDDASSTHDDEDDMQFLGDIELKDEDDSRGDHQIMNLNYKLHSRQFFDNAPKSDVPLSTRFGTHKHRSRVPEKRALPVYNKKDGERKEQLTPRIEEALAGADNFTTLSKISTSATAVGGQGWPSHAHQMSHPSMISHQQMQHQQQLHGSQSGPSMGTPPQSLHPMHPGYMGGTGQMGSFPGQPAGMRQSYTPQGYGVALHQQMQQQQQQYPMGGAQMMMGGQPGQSGYHPGAVRPPGYPGYPAQTGVPMGGNHPMQTPGMPMGYQQGMQNQMMYRPGMPTGSYPPQYGSPMGGMMSGGNGMGGMQMGGQYPGGGPMQQGGMMMQQMPHGQPMIAGAPHPMGMPGMTGHPSFPITSSAPGVIPPTSSAMIMMQRAAEPLKKNRPLALIDEEQTLIASRRGEDPYVKSLSIAPKGLFYKGNRQLKNEFDLYTTELILAKEGRKERRPFGPPTGGSEGLSIVAAVMLQDTILNLHFDWVFDSCPICACTTSIRSKELGVYITPPPILEETVEVQNVWIGTWHGMHLESTDSNICICGFSVIRHRLLSMRSGLFIEDSHEATGDLDSRTNPSKGKETKYLWFNPSSAADHALVETLRSMALTTDIGRLVGAIRNISTMGMKNAKRRGRRRNRNKKIPSIGPIGSSSEYVISQMDKMEVLLMGNSALTSAHVSGNKPTPSVGETPYFHPWGLQIASDVADPTEMEIKNLLEDVKPLIEGAVREARKLTTSTSASSVIEGPLTWRSLAAKNVKCSGNGDDDSHIAEPIPLLEMATEKDAIRIAPTVMKNWEQHNLGPIDVPKDVLYLAVTPDDDKVYDMTVVYVRRISKMYEQNLRLGRHTGYLARDEPNKTNVREGIVRAGVARSQHDSLDSPSLLFVREVEKEAEKHGCSKEFIHKLVTYVQSVEEILVEHLQKNCRIFERDVFRECVGSNLYHRRQNQKQKNTNPATFRNEVDRDDASPMQIDESRKAESIMFNGPLAEALGMTGGSSSNSKAKKKVKRPFGHCSPYGMVGERLFKIPDEEPAALPHIVVIYLGRNGDAARVAMIAIVKAFNSVMRKLPGKHRGQCQLELIPIQLVEESVGSAADLDRLDRSNNLNTWQIGNMHRSAEIYPNDRPKIEDVLKEIAFGIYRKPRFLHCDALKNALPKSMTKFGPASAILDWIDKKDGKKMTMYKCHSVPFQLANTPAIIAKSEAKFSQLCMDEISLYISYCLVSVDFIVVTVTDNLGARSDSAVLNLKPNIDQIGSTFRSQNKSSVVDGLHKLWKYIEGVMLHESKPLRLVIGKLGKMGHGEFKAWCHVLSRSNLKKYSTRVRESCSPCNANAGAPILLSACLVSTEPEAHLQVLPSYSISPDPNGSQKKIRPLHSPGDNTITHIMVFPISPAIQLNQSKENGGAEDEDDFSALDDIPDMEGNDMNDIMNDILMNKEEEGEGRAAARNHHMNSFFDAPLESGVQNQPLAAGWMISTAPGGDLPDWFWSSCPSLKRRLPVHLRSSLHINESQLSKSDDIGMKKEKEQEISHALDSQKTDEVLRHVLEQYNDLSWLAIDSITQERRSCLPIHIQALTRLHDTVINLIM